MGHPSDTQGSGIPGIRGIYPQCTYHFLTRLSRPKGEKMRRGKAEVQEVQKRYMVQEVHMEKEAKQ